MEASEFRSPFSPNTDADRQAMLDASGVASVQELFEDIPAQVRNPYLDLPAPLSELELRREIEEMARSNAVPGDYSCFLGAGSYRQFVPAVVRQIASRGEFMTSYTPYQPEVAQGTLQVTYEFQTLACQLMGMEAANAGMYDGSTSLAEAALMAARITRRDRIAVLDSVSPVYREVLDTYADAPGMRIDTVSTGGETELREGTAALVVQQPGFLGCLEDMEAMAAAAHSQGALLVVYADPIAAGMFKPPGDYGADIVVAEGQALGSPPSFGGPYVGIFHLPGEVPAADAGPRRRQDGRLPRQGRVRADASDQGAAHTPGARYLQHLHLGGAGGVDRHGLHVGSGPAGHPTSRRALLPQGALRRIVDRPDSRLLAPTGGSLLQRVRRQLPAAAR